MKKENQITHNRLLVEDMIDELVDSEIERLAQVFKTTSEVLSDEEHKELDKIFRFDGITPFDKKSNDLIDLEYKETIDKEYEDAWYR